MPAWWTRRSVTLSGTSSLGARGTPGAAHPASAMTAFPWSSVKRRAASTEERRSLANIRTGEYEGLERKLQDPAWAPDAGPARFDARFGAPVVGAREFLIAYNVNLNTRDRKLANEIALAVIVEHGRSGGESAAPVARQILAHFFGLDHAAPPGAAGTTDTEAED